MNQEYINKKHKEYEELCKSEKEIKDNLCKSANFDNNYKKYYLLDYNWYQEYKTYLDELLKGIINIKYTYNAKILNTDTQRNYNKKYEFITNFIIVTEDFVKLLLEYFNFYEKTILYNNKWDIIFGYQCLIIKNIKSDNEICLTFYDENKPNNIDFFLELDKEKLKKHINLILNNNLFFYLGLINFHHNDNSKEIFDNKGNNIGIFICNCESNRSQFLEGMKIVILTIIINFDNSENKN